MSRVVKIDVRNINIGTGFLISLDNDEEKDLVLTVCHIFGENKDDFWEMWDIESSDVKVTSNFYSREFKVIDILYKKSDAEEKDVALIYIEKFKEIIDKQGSIFIIINSPGHNPTGYSLSDDEWDEMLDYAKEIAKDKSKKIIFFVDVAYIDFVKDDIASRKFFKKFGELPENILTIVGFSMSKGYTAYGMRMGAAIGISSNEDIADEFYYSLMHSCRANWSNCNRGAMEVLSHLAENKEKFKDYVEEKNKYKNMLESRAKSFVNGAKEVNLDILPYRDGFFISIPCENPKEVCEELTKENLYLVPLKMGLRFAVCAVSKEKCMKAPKIIKDVIENLSQ